MAILGGVVTDDSRAPCEPTQAQLGKSEAFFWQAASRFTRGSSVRSRMHAWARGARGCAQYASQTWALSGENLHQLKPWELQLLRTALKIRPTPAETDHGAITFLWGEWPTSYGVSLSSLTHHPSTNRFSDCITVPHIAKYPFDFRVGRQFWVSSVVIVLYSGGER